MVAETPPVLQSPKLLGPRPLGQQSAACPCASPTMASSGSSSTSSGTFALGPCGRITSQGICGWPGQGLSANVLTPLPPENGWDPSARPGVPRRQVCPNSEGLASFVHLAPLAHTWLLRSLFWEDSVVSGGALRGARAGVGRWLERVLCWDEALYPHIFLWEWESGSSVALPPSVSSSPQCPSAFCLPSGVTGLGFASASFPFISFSTSDGKHGLCLCQPREARLPPTGIVMEGNLGAAPSRCLHSLSPRRVEP